MSYIFLNICIINIESSTNFFIRAKDMPNLTKVLFVKKKMFTQLPVHHAYTESFA